MAVHSCGKKNKNVFINTSLFFPEEQKEWLSIYAYTTSAHMTSSIITNIDTYSAIAYTLTAIKYT